MIIDHGALRLLWSNWGVVAPGQVYRSNHPTPGRLANAMRRYGVRSVINLRGATSSGSDALSRAQAARLKLPLFDVALSSGRPPVRETVLALADAYATAPRPVLIHCKSGADRAGFAAAVFVLMEGGTVAQAHRQLSWRFGHLRRSRAGIQDAFLLRYARDAEGRLGFLDWVRTEYDAAALAAGYRANGLAEFVQSRVMARE